MVALKRHHQKNNKNDMREDAGGLFDKFEKKSKQEAWKARRETSRRDWDDHKWSGTWDIGNENRYLKPLQSIPDGIDALRSDHWCGMCT